MIHVNEEMPASFDYYIQSPMTKLANATIVITPSDESNHSGAVVTLSWLFIVPVLLLIALIPVAKLAISKSTCWRSIRQHVTSNDEQQVTDNIRDGPLTERDLEFSAISENENQDEEESGDNAHVVATYQIPWNANILRARESYSSTFAAWMTPQPKREEPSEANSIGIDTAINSSNEEKQSIKSKSNHSSNDKMKRMESLTSPSPIKSSSTSCHKKSYVEVPFVDENFLTLTVETQQDDEDDAEVEQMEEVSLRYYSLRI